MYLPNLREHQQFHGTKTTGVPLWGERTVSRFIVLIGKCPVGYVRKDHHRLFWSRGTKPQVGIERLGYKRRDLGRFFSQKTR